MEFNDFWSKNGWLIQYFHHQGVVGESFIITPTIRPPYRSGDRLKGWTVSDIENWLKELDEATLMVTVLAQEKAPALDLRVFPAPDGFWYAAWPPLPQQQPDQIYARVSCFSPHPRLQSWDWEEKLEANRLKNVQNHLTLSAQMIWRAVQRGQ